MLTPSILRIRIDQFYAAGHAGLLNCFPADPAETRYLAVLVHGMFGFNSIAGVDYVYQGTSERNRSTTGLYRVQPLACVA